MLEIRHLSVRFSAQSSVQAVDDVSLTLPDGGKTALVGETGSGKSVLLLAVLRLLPKSAIVQGEVCLNDENVLQMSRKRLCQVRGGTIAYVPQGGGGSMNPLLRVGFQIGEPLMEHRGYTKKQAVAESVTLMRQFNLGNEENLARAYPHTFSGGMRQRTMVAMGISAGANILLADEPTKGLDTRRVEMVQDTFLQLKTESLLCVTHDMMFASRISDHICVLYAAQQVEYGTTEEIIRNPLHPYTQDMISAIPENGMVIRQAGFSPDHGEFGDFGCRYKHRCVCRYDKCGEMPPIFSVGDRKVRCWLYAPAD